jgi:hypothetical protein
MAHVSKAATGGKGRSPAPDPLRRTLDPAKGHSQGGGGRQTRRSQPGADQDFAKALSSLPDLGAHRRRGVEEMAEGLELFCTSYRPLLQPRGLQGRHDQPREDAPQRRLRAGEIAESQRSCRTLQYDRRFRQTGRSFPHKKAGFRANDPLVLPLLSTRAPTFRRRNGAW